MKRTGEEENAGGEKGERPRREVAGRREEGLPGAELCLWHV